MEIHEIVRLLRDGAGDREIVRLVGLNRRTVVRYRHWAAEQGLLAGPLPGIRELEARLAATLPAVVPPQQTSTLAAYRDEILAYRARGLEVAAIRTRLEEAHRQPISYSALWRLVRRLEPPGLAEAFVRVEVPPGSEAQVDFGYAGRHLDPASGLPRKAWVFVLVLSWSRHLYAELVFDQRVETWLLGHRHAFEAFGGVPERVVLDTLKAAILRASATDPLVQRAYRECAAHYGFRIDPNPPRSPHLKGKSLP
jgi:transposase